MSPREPHANPDGARCEYVWEKERALLRAASAWYYYEPKVDSAEDAPGDGEDEDEPLRIRYWFSGGHDAASLHVRAAPTRTTSSPAPQDTAI